MLIICGCLIAVAPGHALVENATSSNAMWSVLFAVLSVYAVFELEFECIRMPKWRQMMCTSLRTRAPFLVPRIALRADHTRMRYNPEYESNASPRALNSLRE